MEIQALDVETKALDVIGTMIYNAKENDFMVQLLRQQPLDSSFIFLAL